jgi:hypothetical protein
VWVGYARREKGSSYGEQQKWLIRAKDVEEIEPVWTNGNGMQELVKFCIRQQ